MHAVVNDAPGGFWVEGEAGQGVEEGVREGESGGTRAR